MDYVTPSAQAHAFLDRLAAVAGTGDLEGVDVYATLYSGDVIEVRNIGVAGALGTGRGSAAFTALMDMADEFGVDLRVQPYGQGATTTERLDAWYRRLGCVEADEPGRLAYRGGSRAVPTP